MHDSLLTRLIADDRDLRIRVEALARKRLATPGNVTATESVVYDPPPVAALAHAVAINPSVFGVVKAALDPEAPDVAAAVNTVQDSDLDFIIVSELPSLG